MEKYGNTNSIDNSLYLIIFFSKNCTFPCTLRIGFSFIKSCAQNARARAMRAPWELQMQLRRRIWVPPPQEHIFRHTTCIVSWNLVLKMRAAPCVLQMHFRPRIWVPPPQKHINRHTTCNFLWILGLECARARNARLKCSFDIRF